MRIVVHEPTTATKKVYSVSAPETIDSYNKINRDIGQQRGDLIAYRGDSDPVRLPVGQNGQVLIADSTQESGLKWETNAETVGQEKGDIVTYKSDGSPVRLVRGVDGQALVANASKAEGIEWGYPTRLKTARTIQTNLGSTTAGSFDGSGNVSAGVTGVLKKANGGTGNADGNADSADKLSNTRTFRVYLGTEYDSSGSTTAQGKYDLGSGPINIPVTGKLAVKHGGTGGTTWQTAQDLLGFIGGTCQGDSTTNLDNDLHTLIKATLSSSINTGLHTAIGASFAYVIQVFYADEPGLRTRTSNRLQIAFPYGNTRLIIAYRTYYQSAWGPWHKITATDPE